MQLELNHLSWIIIVIGALIGSIKANLDDKEQPLCTKIFNVILGSFCGIAIAGEYSVNLTYWLSGMLALVGGMLGGTILDVLSELAPGIVKSYLKNRFK